MNIVCCVALALMLPGKFYPSVSYTSDYRYNGVSYSGRSRRRRLRCTGSVRTAGTRRVDLRRRFR